MASCNRHRDRLGPLVPEGASEFDFPRQTADWAHKVTQPRVKFPFTRPKTGIPTLPYRMLTSSYRALVS